MIVPAKAPELKLFYKPKDDNGPSIDPYAVLESFFSDYTLDDIKDELWALLKAALGDAEDKTPAHFVYLYEKLNDLCTASYIIGQSNLLESQVRS